MAQIAEVSLKANDIDKEFIREMIEEAMEKGDRDVSIFATGVGVTVNIRPRDTGKPRWIKTPKGVYRCSECGMPSRFTSPYCSECGEKLAYANFIEEDE